MTTLSTTLFCRRRLLDLGVKVAAVVVTFSSPLHPAWPQLSERPGNSGDNPIDLPRDLSGLSVKSPRIRIVHTTDPQLPGGSMYLQKIDPWLGYQWGRDLFQREFRDRDGVYGDAGKLDGITLSDGATKIMSRSHVNSCAACHNVPFRDAGAGMTIAKNAGTGRNTPHLFGAGLIEMIGQQLRLEILAIADENRDGWISFDESENQQAIVDGVDYGVFADENGDGRPDLNNAIQPVFVDDKGQRIAFATGLDFGGVAGYTIEFLAFGFGHQYLPNKTPIASTLRAFNAQAFDIHMGIQPCDATTLDDPDGDGFSQISNAGVLQPLSQAGKDRGRVKGKTGISFDDPDRDGYCEELSEGDLDMVEWYLLNHPAPGRGKETKRVRSGEKLFSKIGCADCHKPDWAIHPPNPAAEDYTKRFGGDRRFMDVAVAYNKETDRLEGRVRRILENQGNKVRGIYSDFKYHEMGTEMQQVQFDGSVIRQWRTTPLWGAGSTAPYGHDGASLTLNAIIQRHGGEAAASRKQFGALPKKKQRQVIAFLESLVLYQTDQIPCDVDGDDTIEEQHQVAGMNVGVERLRPEWLFNVPVKIEGEISNLDGSEVVSFAAQNRDAAYGLQLEALLDRDEDGFPDMVDPAPDTAGYLNGSR